MLPWHCRLGSDRPNRSLPLTRPAMPVPESSWLTDAGRVWSLKLVNHRPRFAMRALITTAILVLFALGSSARDEKKYRSKEGMFAIQFPTGAKVKTDTKEEGVIKAIITSATVMGADYSVN